MGKARTFDSEDDFVKAVESGSIEKGKKTVVILRYLGPQGGPGEFFVLRYYPCHVTNEPRSLVPDFWVVPSSIFFSFFHRLVTTSELLLTSDRYARNAETHEFDHGCRSGIGCCLSHGWAIQRRVSYSYLFNWIRLAILFLVCCLSITLIWFLFCFRFYLLVLSGFTAGVL